VKEKKADLHIKFDEPANAEIELKEILKLREKHFQDTKPLPTQEKLIVHSYSLTFYTISLFVSLNLIFVFLCCMKIATLKDKLARVYTKLQKYDEAQKLFQEIITIKTECLGQHHWFIFFLVLVFRFLCYPHTKVSD
jgi:hypothetical protein